MRGRTSNRVSSISSKNGPQTWNPKKVLGEPADMDAKSESGARAGFVKWKKGDFWDVMCDPAFANGLLWIGTANPIGKKTEDASVLACFDAMTGALLYQHVSPKIGVASQDWAGTGNTSTPFIEGNRLWFCTNRLEVIRLNILPLVERKGDPIVEWIVDLKTRFHVVPKDVHLGNRASRCSIVGVDGRIFVNTTNSFGYEKQPSVDPNAPSLVCLNQDTGETVWTDNSPGADIARNQHCNPVIFEQDGKNFVAIGQGDGDVSRENDVDGVVAENRNSRLIWEHTESEGEKIHISTAGLCVTSTLLFSADIDGFVKCFDKRTGQLHWKHDTQSAVIATPLVVGGSLYVADEDGDIEVLRASVEYDFIASMNHQDPIESSPIYADDTLFFVTRNQVYAVGK